MHRCQTARWAPKRRTPHLPCAGGAFGKNPWGSALSARFPPILRPYVVSAGDSDLGRSCDPCDAASWRLVARPPPTRGIEGPPAAASPLPGAGRARRPPGRRVAAPCPRVFEFDRSSSRASCSSHAPISPEGEKKSRRQCLVGPASAGSTASGRDSLNEVSNRSLRGGQPRSFTRRQPPASFNSCTGSTAPALRAAGSPANAAAASRSATAPARTHGPAGATPRIDPSRAGSTSR